MSIQRTSVAFAPSSAHGIPEHVRLALRKLLERDARDRWEEHGRAIDVRFRDLVRHVDALQKNGRHLPDTPQETRDLIDATPTRLCRLGYLGTPDRWAFAFYKYSDEIYEPSFLPPGAFEGTSEEAFDCAAGVSARRMASLPAAPR